MKPTQPTYVVKVAFKSHIFIGHITCRACVYHEMEDLNL